MSRVSTDRESVRDLARRVLLSGPVTVSAPSALTAASGAVTLTYSSNNPGYTFDNAQVIANGGSVTALENQATIAELDNSLATIIADITAARTAVAALLTAGVYDTSLAAGTMQAFAATNKLVNITYTASDPAITPDNAITVANGSAVTAAESHHMAVELNKELYLLSLDVGAVYARAKVLFDQKSFQGLTAIPAMVSNATMVAITYTTNNPSITPDGTSTISNGSSPTAAENWHSLVEIKDQGQKARADVLALRTTLAAILAIAGIS